MTEELATVLKTSDDPKKLLGVATQLASGDKRSDHELLLKHLRSQDFLYRINTKEEYAGARENLRVRRVLDALENNNAQSARDTLLELTANPVFNADGSRTELLIEASVVLRPAPPELVDYWDRYCQPDDGFTPLSVVAMLENGSAPALELFEKKMLDPAQGESGRWYEKIIDLSRFEGELIRLVLSRSSRAFGQ